MEFDNTNKGALFVNQDKKTDRHPDFTGKIDVDSRELRIAGWKKVSKAGKHYLKLEVSEPQQQQQTPPSHVVADDPFGDSLSGAAQQDPDDTIPF